MKQAYCSKLLSIRKNDLQRQILEAVELSDEKKLSLLKLQCAHRYGLETLRDFLKVESFDDLEPSSHLPHEFDPVQLDVIEKCGVSALGQSAMTFGETEKDLEGIDLEVATSEASRSFDSEELEDLNISEDGESSIINSNKLRQQDLLKMEVPPPPRSAPKRLLRWLPASEENYPKAS